MDSLTDLLSMLRLQGASSVHCSESRSAARGGSATGEPEAADATGTDQGCCGLSPPAHALSGLTS